MSIGYNTVVAWRVTVTTQIYPKLNLSIYFITTYVYFIIVVINVNSPNDLTDDV